MMVQTLTYYKTTSQLLGYNKKKINGGELAKIHTSLCSAVS